MKIDISGLDTRYKALRFVSDCEAEFEESIKRCALRVSSTEGCRAVTLAGPTCSGKTTAANHLTAQLARLGKKAVLISIDDYYYPKDEMKRRGIDNFEGATAIDTALFRETAAALSCGREVLIPKYDFTVKNRVALAPYTPSENDIYIFEGIQAIYPEILSCLDSFVRFSIFICVSESLEIGSVSFEPNEIRLMRRAVRDNYHRGTTVAETMVLWKNVRENEDINIFPYVGDGDHSINSLIPYEVFIVGREFLSLTEGYSACGANAKEVYSLRERLAKVMNINLRRSDVPDASLLCEFSE